MIQFNLLPDVKKEYVKAKRTKRLIYSASLVVSAAAVGVTIVMFTFVHGLQKKQIDDKTNEIANAAAEIQATPNLNRILTLQNQLSLLPTLHESKPQSSRLFDYITFMTPKEVAVSSLDVDYEDSMITIKGTADKLVTVNKFVENIKAVRYASVGASEDEEKFPYSEVQTELTGDNDGANYEINFEFDPTIFDNTQQLVLRLGTETTSLEAEEDR